MMLVLVVATAEDICTYTLLASDLQRQAVVRELLVHEIKNLILFS